MSKPGNKRLRLVLLIASSTVLIYFISFRPVKIANAQTPTWNLVWSDEFNGTGGVNTSDWIYDVGTGWGTGEIETMTNSTSNVFQSGGNLNVVALHSGGSPTTGWTSGRIESVRADFQPPPGGMMAVEASLQQPNVTTTNGLGYWPAFWMLGAPFRTNGNWPSIGEIDILEDINGRSSVFSTFHCGTNPVGPCNEPSGIGSGEMSCPGCQTGFHTYRVEYDRSVSPEELRWYLDGVQIFIINSSRVDATTWNNATNHAFFIIFDLAMGGGFPDAFGGGPTSATVSGGTMMVDYVRVYYSSASSPTPTPTPSCSFVLGGSSQNFGAAGSPGNVSVTADSGCGWNALSNDSFITITSGSSGNGNGSVGFSVAANSGPSRTGTMTIAGQTFTVTQDASPNPAQMQFSSSVLNGGEASGIATITVNRSGDTTGVSTIDYLTSDGTAKQSSDYEIGSGTITFPAGATQQTFTVLIDQDTFVDPGETFSIALSNATGGTVGAISSTTVTITDDDTASAVTPNPKWFVADVAGGNVVPGSGSNARAAAVFQLSQDETTAAVSMTITAALHGTETSASINGPAAAGSTGPVVFALPLGSFKDAQILISPAQVTQLKAGLLYITVQTSGFAGGEIRGQLLTNPMDDPGTFVLQQYYDLLARQSDAGGFAFWTGQITNQGTDPVNIRNTRVGVSDAFFFEQEYQQTGSYVFRLYRAAYGNNQPFPNPDPSNVTEAKKIMTYSVFSRDRARVIGGADLATGQQSLANQFVVRPEFIAKYPLSLDGPGFVDAVLATVNTDLGVNLTSQRAGLITLFNSGGRGAVMYRIADESTTNPIANQALIDEEYSRSFVATDYFGYLRRDADIAGFLFWLGQVNSAPLRDVPKQHAMSCSFITSAEYQFRFGPVASRNNTECPQ